jgi:hypothetical protein
MGATDQPFSVTSKYTAETGAELLVTVRGTTAETFRHHLDQAIAIFPRAGFTAAGQPQPEPQADPQAPVSITQARAQVSRQEEGAAAHANLIAERNAQEQAARGNGHKCAKHGRASESKYFDGLYCPSMDADTGERCKWTYRREQQAATGA